VRAIARRDLDIASRGRRCAAGAVDDAALLASMAAIVGAMFVSPDRAERIRARLESERTARTLRAFTFVLGIATRNMRGPGAVLFGLRRVDLRTHGPVSLRGALIRHYATAEWTRLTLRFVLPYERRQREQIQALQSQLEAIRQQHADDPQAEQRATMDLFAAHRVKPGRGCLVGLVAGLIPQLAFIWTPRGQSIPDWLAGVVVVRDRR
jgi:RDD family